MQWGIMKNPFYILAFLSFAQASAPDIIQDLPQQTIAMSINTAVADGSTAWTVTSADLASIGGIAALRAYVSLTASKENAYVACTTLRYEGTDKTTVTLLKRSVFRVMGMGIPEHRRMLTSLATEYPTPLGQAEAVRNVCLELLQPNSISLDAGPIDKTPVEQMVLTLPVGEATSVLLGSYPILGLTPDLRSANRIMIIFTALP